MTITEFVFAALFVLSSASLFNQTRRMQELERKLNLVLTHLGIDPNSKTAPSAHVRQLAADSRQRIAAIKAYREQTGADVTVAAAVVDEIAAGSKGESA